MSKFSDRLSSLSEGDISAIIQMAWEDRTAFETIQQRMGDSSRAVFENGEVSFKRSRDGTQLDTARLAREQPEIVKAYTVPKPGSRRFLVQT